MSSSQQFTPLSSNRESLLKTNNISTARAWLLRLPLLGFIVQILIEPSYVNITCSALAATGAFIVFFDAFRVSRLYIYPLSTWVLLGFGVTLQLGPLLFTALEGKPISYNLELPVAVLLNSFIVSLAVLFSHAIYRRSLDLARLRVKVQHWLSRIGIFRPLSLPEVICLTLTGILSFSIRELFPFLASARLLIKFVQGFGFLLLIPNAYILQGLVRSRLQDYSLPPPIVQRKVPLIVLSIVTLLTLIISLIINTRRVVIIPIAALALGVAFEWLYGFIRVRIRDLLGILLLIVLMLPLFSDIATAMVMVRGNRANVPPIELAWMTLDVLQDRPTIRDYRETRSEEGVETTTGWSEVYLDNVFLSRFANLKFADNSLVDASGIPPGSSAEKEFKDFQFKRLLTVLPAPLLTIFGMTEEEKDAILRPSWGDMLHGLSIGISDIGGLRVTHFFGTGTVGFGMIMYVLIPVTLLLPFALIDAHSQIDASGPIQLVPPRFSIISITQLYGWFILSNYHSVTEFIVFPARLYFEPIILFMVVRWSVRFLFTKS